MIIKSMAKFLHLHRVVLAWDALSKPLGVGLKPPDDP